MITSLLQQILKNNHTEYSHVPLLWEYRESPWRGPLELGYMGFGPLTCVPWKDQLHELFSSLVTSTNSAEYGLHPRNQRPFTRSQFWTLSWAVLAQSSSTVVMGSLRFCRDRHNLLILSCVRFKPQMATKHHPATHSHLQSQWDGEENWKKVKTHGLR